MVVLSIFYRCCNRCYGKEALMSKVIFKSPYAKSKGHAATNLRYIAERDGVDKSINTIVNNMNYIANRPRVVKVGSHGLFGQKDNINLKKAEAELRNHTGIVWQPIISLRREDAEKLGFNNPKKWRTYLRSKQVEIANTYRIPIKDLVWYAAFHNEGDHPHIHMIIYNKNPSGEYLSKKSINNFREILIKDIFKNELKFLYDERQSLRDKIIEQAKENIKNYAVDIPKPNSDFQEKYQELQFVLENYHGKRKYKFLKSEQKKAVDNLLKELEKDKNIQYLYNQWQQIQLAILGIYSKDPKLKYKNISEDENFYRLKNVILDETFAKMDNGMYAEDGYIDNIYPDMVFSICKAIDTMSYKEIEQHHSQSIVDSKDRIKEYKKEHGMKMY